MEYYVYEEQVRVNEIITWVVYIILPVFVGGYASDYFKTVSQKNMRISINRVLLAAVIATIISLALLDFINMAERLALLAFISLVLGMVGFEFLYGMSSFDNMVVLLKKITSLFSPILSLAGQINELRAFAIKQKLKDASNDENSENESDDLL